MNWLVGVAIVFAISGGFSQAVAEGTTTKDASLDDVLGGSLEDLLNMKTSVATKRATGTRSTPGAVTIITDEDIRNMGARDLVDVLRTVPSLEFGVDVQGVIGIGVRGLWAHEGKALLIIDGIELNEIHYGTNQFSSHYPIDQIQRIEIIRGPGSVIYGGFAELAVINITTKSGEDLKGSRAQYTKGVMARGSERDVVSLQHGNNISGWDYKVAGYFSDANHGEGSYLGTGDTHVGSFNMEDADRLHGRMVNAGLTHGGLKLHALYDEYTIDSRAQYGDVGLVPNAIPNQFRSLNFAGSYDLTLGDWTISPHAHYYHQNPWRTDSEEAYQYALYSRVYGDRTKAGVTLGHSLFERGHLLLGYEYIHDQNRIDELKTVDDGDLTFSNGSNIFSLTSHAVFAQWLYETSLANVAVGARYEDPDRTNSSLVPRFSATHEEKDWHAKLMYSQAFRSPVLYNIDIEPNIKPEKTETTEVEVGHSMGANHYLTGNLFYTKIEDPIVYFTNGTDDVYANKGNVATKGLELDWRYRAKMFHAQLGYSYYMLDVNKVPEYHVEAERHAVLGMPQHRIVLNGTSYLGASRSLKLNNTLAWQGERYAMVADSATNSMKERKLDSFLRWDLYLSKEDLFVHGFSAGLGVHNLLNSRDAYIQPYDGGHSPLPGPSREYIGRVEYAF